jgi:hypothetical protein
VKLDGGWDLSFVAESADRIEVGRRDFGAMVGEIVHAQAIGNPAVLQHQI